MKKLIFIIILTLISITFIWGQSVKIVPKKIVYQIPNSVRVDDYLEVVYPQIKSKINKSVKKNLHKTISYWNNWGSTLKEELEDGGNYLYNYQIQFNQNNLLQIQLIQEGSAAYPWTNRIVLLVDLRTGKEIKFKDVFKRNTQKHLFNKIKPQFEKERQKAISEGSEYDVEDDKYKLRNMEDFTISKKGVTFHYDFGFAFGRLASQPKGKYFFSWKQIKPFIKRGGLLQKFIH